MAAINTLTPWYNQAEGTLMVELEMPSQPVYSISAVSFGLSDGSFNNSIYLSHPNSGDYFNVVNGGVSQSSIGFAGTPPVTVKKIAGAYKLNDFALYRNGAAAAPDAVGTLPPTATTATIGRAPFGSGNQIGGWLRKIRYWRTRRPNAELQQITAI
jgi:hypothetical protein